MTTETAEVTTPRKFLSEDWWAITTGMLILVVSFLIVRVNLPADLYQNVAQGKPFKITNPAARWLSKPGSWESNPVDAIYRAGKSNALPGMLGVFVVLLGLVAVAMHFHRGTGLAVLKGFPVIFLLGILAYVLAGQSVINAYNLEYVLWALVVGMLISNTVGTPGWLRPAALTEFYIKTGLVLLGAEVLMSRLLALGAPGVLVSWTVTPVVLITTYWFGQRVLKMESRSLNMVISADMSVCGVSAAIATAAACRAKKEELSLAIGLSLVFTVVMMVVMPWIINAVGMDEVLAGAWLGGTIDSTGAVTAAGELVGKRAMEVAATVKMIQNILIGVVAFGVAVYWVTWVERVPNGPRPSVSEIWRRFPRFVLGFVAASILFSLVNAYLPAGPEQVDAMIKGSSGVLRGWLFCLAFVSIGLETNFREMSPYLRTGKPMTLYLCGQALNLILSLLMSWLMFSIVFKDSIQTR